MLGLAGWMLWQIRSQIRWLRRGFVALTVMLAIVMKAPIWFVLARVSALTGGDGYHRSQLIDVALQNIDKWWLAGMPIRDTIRWFPYFLDITGGADITNNYLSFGITAGLGAVALLLVLLIRVCRNLGRTLARYRTDSKTARDNEYLVWGLGVMMVVHMFNWLEITYFDQTYVFWFMELAVISSLTQKPNIGKSELTGLPNARTSPKARRSSTAFALERLALHL